MIDGELPYAEAVVAHKAYVADSGKPCFCPTCQPPVQMNLVTARFEHLLNDAKANLKREQGFLAQREKNLTTAEHSLATATAHIKQLDAAMVALEDDGTKLPTAFAQMEVDLSEWVDSQTARQREVNECERHVTKVSALVESYAAQVVEFGALLDILTATKNPPDSLDDRSESETPTDGSTT